MSDSKIEIIVAKICNINVMLANLFDNNIST